MNRTQKLAFRISQRRHRSQLIRFAPPACVLLFVFVGLCELARASHKPEVSQVKPEVLCLTEGGLCFAREYHLEEQ